MNFGKAQVHLAFTVLENTKILQVLGEIVEYLRAVVGRRSAPTGERGDRGFDRVANILSVAAPNFLAVHGQGITSVGAGLFAADKELVGPV